MENMKKRIFHPWTKAGEFYVLEKGKAPAAGLEPATL
jgi:hypothetical protein